MRALEREECVGSDGLFPLVLSAIKLRRCPLETRVIEWEIVRPSIIVNLHDFKMIEVRLLLTIVSSNSRRLLHFSRTYCLRFS